MSDLDNAVMQSEDYIDHEFLFHNEHVKVIGKNTVSISGTGVVKTILSPGTGEYPLPKALCEIALIGRVQENGDIFQDTRNPNVEEEFVAQKRREIFAKQLAERVEKNQTELKKYREEILATTKIPEEEDEEYQKIIARHTAEMQQHELDFKTASEADNRYKLYLQPKSFQLGAKDAVRGLELAVATMRAGEKALITCQPQLAFSELGIEDFIPDKAVIEFEVELLSTTSANIQIYPGVIKRYLKKGEGWSTPEANTTCHIFIEGNFACDDGKGEDEDVKPKKRSVDEQPEMQKYTTRTFLKRTEHPLQARIDDVLLPEGLEQCLRTMKKGEIALFEISKNVLLGNGFEPKRHCFKLPIPETVPIMKPAPTNGETHPVTGKLLTGNPLIDDDEHDDLIVYYYVEMVELAHHVDPWSLRLEQKIAETERLKEVANEFLRMGVQNNQITDVPPQFTCKHTIGHLQRAIQRYDACLDIYEHFQEYEQKQCTYDMIMRVLSVQLACFNNLQIIYMKYKDYKKVVENAEKALKLFMEPVDIYKQQQEEENKEQQQEEQQTENKTQQDESSALVEATAEDEEKSPEAYTKPTLEMKLVRIGKTFPPQTKTNNLYKTLYRKAQALLLSNDVTGAREALQKCSFIYAEKDNFNKWLVEKNIDLTNKTQQITELYKDQPILNNNIVPVKHEDKETNKEELLPLNFDAVTDDIKKECDKLSVLVEKKYKAQNQRSKSQFAKAFGSD